MKEQQKRAKEELKENRKRGIGGEREKIIALRVRVAEFASHGTVIDLSERHGSVSPRARKICTKKWMLQFYESGQYFCAHF